MDWKFAGCAAVVPELPRHILPVVGILVNLKAADPALARGARTGAAGRRVLGSAAGRLSSSSGFRKMIVYVAAARPIAWSKTDTSRGSGGRLSGASCVTGYITTPALTGVEPATRDPKIRATDMDQ